MVGEDGGRGDAQPALHRVLRFKFLADGGVGAGAFSGADSGLALQLLFALLADARAEREPEQMLGLDFLCVASVQGGQKRAAQNERMHGRAKARREAAPYACRFSLPLE